MLFFLLFPVQEHLAAAAAAAAGNIKMMVYASILPENILHKNEYKIF